MKLVTKHKLENNQLYYYEIQRYGKTYHKGKGVYVSDFHYYKNNQQTRLNNNIFCFIEPHSLNKSEWQKNPRFERMYHHHTHPEIEYKYYIPQKDTIIKKSLMRMKYMATCKMLKKITQDDAFLNVHMKPYFM